MRALIGKKWDPVNWNEDIWVDLDEVEDTEFLNSARISLPIEAAFLHLTKEVSLALRKGSVTASSEIVILKDTTDSPHDHTQYPSLLSYL